jgi:putative transposase
MFASLPWPIVYFDGIVVHVRGANGRVAQHTIYVALGVNLDGHKELLGLWLSENEGAKFWLSCLTDLKNRESVKSSSPASMG